MSRLLLLLIMLALGVSCSPGKPENKTEAIIKDSEKAEMNRIENIRFDFSAQRIDAFKETIEIKATLYNDNTDTVYFLSSSCEGEQYSLQYDTTKLMSTPRMNCNISFSALLKIAPKGQHSFKAYFGDSNKETKIKLGFDFYAADKSIDLTTLKLADIYRPEKEQTIIWADEKTIE